MKKSKKMILLVIGVSFLLISVSSFSTSIQTQYKIYEENKTQITVNDLITGTEEEFFVEKDIVLELLDFELEKITPETFTSKTIEKIDILKKADLIDEKTANFLTNFFIKKQNSFDYRNSKQVPLFDLVNLFSGVSFMVKGERTFKSLDFPVGTFPFINSNITALFSILSSFDGDGFIFTLGTLGLKHLYDFNSDLYPFPYFPGIKGSVIGFSGVFIKMIIGNDYDEEFRGTFFMGMGMNFGAIWSNK
jgi:hypothetical protein